MKLIDPRWAPIPFAFFTKRMGDGRRGQECPRYTTHGRDGRAYGAWTVWGRSSGRAPGTMADPGGGAGSGRGIPRPMVLAPAGVARVARRNGGSGALAMAGGDSLGARIRGGSTLHLGLRVDGTRNACARGSAAAISGGGFLPLRAKPDVLGLCSWVDRAVGGLWTRQPGSDRCRRGRCPRRASVCRLL